MLSPSSKSQILEWSWGPPTQPPRRAPGFPFLPRHQGGGTVLSLGPSGRTGSFQGDLLPSVMALAFLLRFSLVSCLVCFSLSHPPLQLLWLASQSPSWKSNRNCGEAQGERKPDESPRLTILRQRINALFLDNCFHRFFLWKILASPS